MKNKYLDYISDEDLTSHVKSVLDKANIAKEKVEVKIKSNKIDPFSAVFDASYQEIFLSLWLEQEKMRQVQKTLQNAIGEFHQNILGSVNGWEDMKTGSVFDLRSKRRKVIAEVKNKYNTTKGNHKVRIYDDLVKGLRDHNGFTAYYVEIIPKGKDGYNKPFVPPDNVLKKRRKENEKIRVIDGEGFYALVTGQEDALEKLYLALPRVIRDILGSNFVIESEDMYYNLFNDAFH